MGFAQVDSKLLETFLAVVRFGNLTNAAEHLLVAQSTVSHRLARLEASLGTELLDRGRGLHSTSLTPAGEELLSIAERLETLLSEMMAIRGTNKLTLTVGAPASVHVYLLANVYKDCARKDSLSLSLVTAPSTSLYEMLLRHEIDLAFVGFQRPVGELASRLFLQEPLVVVTRNHQLATARLGPLHPRSFDPSHELRLDWGPSFQQWHDGLWPPSHRAVEVEPAYLAVPFLEDPRKWAIMPQSMGLSLMDSDGCLVHELTDPPPARTLYMAHRRRLTPHARRAIELFIDTCESVISEAKVPYTR